MISAFIIVSAILVAHVAKSQRMKPCEEMRTYYSTIIHGCVECPELPNGCTARLNNATLTNCLRDCLKYFSAIPRPSDATSAVETDRMKTYIIVAMVGSVLIPTIIASVILALDIRRRKKRSSKMADVENNNKNNNEHPRQLLLLPYPKFNEGKVMEEADGIFTPCQENELEPDSQSHF